MNAAETTNPGSSPQPLEWHSQSIAQRVEQLALPDHVRLVAVSKTFPAAAIRAAYAAGIPGLWRK